MGKFGQTAKRVAAGAATIGVAAGGAAAKMVGLASDAEETASKFKIVFGREAARATKELDKFSKAAGTSRFELREQAAGFQALIRPMGLSIQNAGKMSVGLTRLATDLASFNNTSVEDAMIALKAGLVGESEPLRRYGVQLSAARVQAFAYSKGIAKTGEELTSAQKAQASYALILKDTKLAQGDAVRTSGSFANQFKRLKASITDTATELGSKLLPTATSAVGGITRFIAQFKAGEGTAGQFRAALENVGGAIGAVARAVGPAVAAIGKLSLGFLGSTRGITVLSTILGALAGRMAGLFAVLAVGKITAFVASIRAAGGAMSALTAAMASNPFGLVAVAIGAVAGALIGFRSQTDGAKQSQQEFSSAVDGSRNAFDRYRTAIDAVKDSNLAHKGAVLNLRAAEANLASLRRSGTASSLQINQAEHQVATARREVKRTADDARVAETRKREETDKSIGALRRYIPTLADRARREQNTIGVLRRSIETDKAAGASKSQLRGRVQALKEMMSQHAGTTSRLSARIKELGLSSIPAKDKIAILRSAISHLREQGEGSTDKVRALRLQLAALSKNKKLEVQVLLDMAVAPGSKKKLRNLMDFAPGGGGSGRNVGPSVRGAIQKTSQGFIDQNKRDILSDFLSGKPGAVGRAKGNLGKYEGIGHQMGLATTSGFRPGDDGWHGKNRARDLSGPPGKMLKYAQHLFQKYGKNLLELIYTPMAVGIKNGQGVNIMGYYGSAVAADHYDHVHVAAQRGAVVPGRGSGDKVPVHAMLEPGERFGVLNRNAAKAWEAMNGAFPRFQKGGIVTAAKAAFGAGFRGNALLKMLMIAGRESGYNPRAQNLKYPDHSIGLWQINQLAHKGRFGSDAQLKDPYRNARAAFSLYKASGLTPWHGMVDTGRFRGTALKAISALKRGGKGRTPGKPDNRIFSLGGGKLRSSAGTMAYEVVPQKGRRFSSGIKPRTIEGATADQLVGDVGGSAGPSGPSPAEQLAEAHKAQAEQSANVVRELAALTAEMRSVTALGLRDAWRVIGDSISGELGVRGAQRGRTPGTGQLARY